ESSSASCTPTPENRSTPRARSRNGPSATKPRARGARETPAPERAGSATGREADPGFSGAQPLEHAFGDPVAQPSEELIARVARELARRRSDGFAERTSTRERAQKRVAVPVEIQPPDLVVLSPHDDPGGLAADVGVVVVLVLDRLEVRVDRVGKREDT